ncbi:hypothetical protein [Achromobacter anxifer]|nr:hypothetical protein [Achromobacter anxifer]MDF8365252.1 hypothetical protein [Achromobacter anxifer]
MGGVEGLCDHLVTLTDAMLAQARFCEADADLGDVTHGAPSSIQ